MTDIFSMLFPETPGHLMPPQLKLVNDYVQYGARLFPDREMLVSGEQSLTYSQAADSIDRIAISLIAAGIRKGDRVATLMPPCPEYFMIFLATVSIGGVWLGLNPRYTRRELAHPLKDSEPKLLLFRKMMDNRDYEQDVISLVPKGSAVTAVASGSEDAVSEHIMSWDEFLAGGEEKSAESLQEVRENVYPDDIGLIVYTSGTTGKPKGAAIRHSGLVFCSLADIRYNPGSLGRRILCNFPINHIACVGDVCCTTLVAGGTLVFMESFDPPGILRSIENYRLTHLGQIPVMLQSTFSQQGVENYDLSSLQYIIWGGNPASLELVRRLKRYATNLLNIYGMTETTGNVLYARSDACDEETLATTVGWPLPVYDVALFLDDAMPVPRGEVGEIRVGGDFVMAGYWNNPSATADAFDANGRLCTGDLAFQRDDGAFCIVGRKSEMYKSGGYNIYPSEIEQVIEKLPGVDMAVVIGVPDPLYSEVGHAFVVKGREKVTQEGLEAHCRKYLANYKIPKAFHFLREFPILPNGKVDRLSLRGRIAST